MSWSGRYDAIGTASGSPLPGHLTYASDAAEALIDSEWERLTANGVRSRKSVSTNMTRTTRRRHVTYGKR